MEKQDTEKKYIPPRHWGDLDELNPAYWNNSKVQEQRGQEFYLKPIETLELIEKLDTAGLARREFLTVMGASMALASSACVRKPVHKIIPYVVKPVEVTPGIATWYASTCQECSVGCGILAKTREGRPIKLEGNPDHPINQGSLCARGQASVLDLYDLDRITTPVRVKRGSGEREPASWDEISSTIHSKLKEVVSKGGKVRILSRSITGPSTQRLVEEFLSSFRDGKLVQFEPLAFDEIALGQQECYGTYTIPSYQFDRAEVIVSFGADFLGNWISPLEHSADWAKNRKLQHKNQAQMSKFYCFESTFTITGGNADERFPVRPGDETKVALAIANFLLKRTQYALDPNIVGVLRNYTPETVAHEIGMGLTASKIQEIANLLWAARGKSLVVGGGGHSKIENPLGLQIAVNFLNSILENEGQTVNSSLNVLNQANGFRDLSKLIQEMKAGEVDVLILYRTNGIYHLPTEAGFEEALKKVPFVIAVTGQFDETAQFADLVLADHHYLENWGDAHPRANIYSLQQPTVSPIHNTRAFQDILLGWIKGAVLQSNGIAARVSAANGNWYEYLKENWKETLHPLYGGGKAFNSFWEDTLEKGVLVTGTPALTRRNFKTISFKNIPSYQKTNIGADEFNLVLYPKISLGDGTNANNSWLQEMPDPITTITWDNYVNISSATAKKLALRKNDVVTVSNGSIQAELPVHIQPGIHPQAVSIAIGYGRERVGNVGNKCGVNVYPFVKVKESGLVFSGAKVTLRKTGKRYELAGTQGHHATENRPIINDVTLKEYRQNPAAENHTDPHLRMKEIPTIWPKHPYDKPYRWGMAIDLNSCIGCGACVIACQAENNIPVVGRAQVRMSREMQWLRIDRYYSGPEDNPKTVFQPMLCQHCENAPCETVCPVLATVHNDEGLNEMVYNRCVGTRYCQNNCPYKVRRFNFFDHWKQYKDTLNMAWNPDVTVRSRGVMEKCTFCIQRIQEAKSSAKDKGELIKDGELKTACQQTCPTQAITFGNINDPKSMVSKQRAEPRAFQVLEVLNTKPSISYLTKVRNIEEGGHDGHH